MLLLQSICSHDANRPGQAEHDLLLEVAPACRTVTLLTSVHLLPAAVIDDTAAQAFLRLWVSALWVTGSGMIFMITEQT